jgi:hypothetical protein
VLRLVHDTDPDERDERRGYRYGGDRGGRPDPRDYSDADRPRPSALVRTMRTLALGIAFLGVAFLAYLAGQARMLDPWLSRVMPVPASATAPALTPPALNADTRTANSGGVAPAAQHAAPSAAPSPIPDVPILVMLVRNALFALHQANITGNYAVLLALSSPQFQQQNTPETLTKAFAGLRAANLDLAEVAATNPNLYSPPALDKDGLLQLRGFFPIGATRVDFELAFQLVANRWRVFAIGVHPPSDAAKAAPPVFSAKAIPPDPQLIALIRTSIAALNQANVTGNYSVLHDIGAQTFQAANPPEKLAQAFANIRGRGLDLSATAVIDPRLFRPAGFDANGYLRIAGYFPSRPEQLNFDLVFQFENGAWRLFGIGVDSSREQPPAAATP